MTKNSKYAKITLWISFKAKLPALPNFYWKVYVVIETLPEAMLVTAVIAVVMCAVVSFLTEFSIMRYAPDIWFITVLIFALKTARITACVVLLVAYMTYCISRRSMGRMMSVAHARERERTRQPW